MMNQFSTNPQERLRILESDYSLMRDRFSILNQNLMESHKRLSQEIRILHQEIQSLKTELSEARILTNHIVQEINQFARKDQVRVLEKYINLWSPLNFATQKDLEKAIQELKEKERGDKHRTSTKTKKHH